MLIRKRVETTQAFSGKMVSVKVNLRTRRKRHFVGINLQAVADGNLQVIGAVVNVLYKRTTAAATCENVVSC